MKPIYNKKHFLVAEISTKQMHDDLNSPCICDMCNCDVEKIGYYVGVLGYYVCNNCYNSWLKKAKNYQEDRDIEKKRFIEFISGMRDFYVGHVVDLIKNDVVFNKIQWRLYVHFQITDLAKLDLQHKLSKKEYYVVANSKYTYGEDNKIYITKNYSLFESAGISIYIGKVNIPDLCIEKV